MDRHIDPRFVAGGHDAVEEIDQVFEQLFVRDARVFLQEPVQLRGRVAFVPTRKMQIFRIERKERFVIVAEARSSRPRFCASSRCEANRTRA